MPNLQSHQKGHVYRILTNDSGEYIRMCSCPLNLRAFGAIADVANHGKSVKLPFLATFGRLVLPILANFMDCQNWKEKSGNDA